MNSTRKALSNKQSKQKHEKLPYVLGAILGLLAVALLVLVIALI